MFRIRSDLLILVLVVVASACTHNVVPKVTPQKIPSVQPPINSRALLLLTTSFEGYTTQSSSGVHHYNYRLGQSVAAALSDLIAQSFARGETRHLADAEVLQWLSAPADTSTADLLLIPYFESGGARERAFDAVAEARFRVDVRSLRSKETFAWTVAGRSARVWSSRKGLTGSALEQALQALSDTLAAHRADLEVGPVPPL